MSSILYIPGHPKTRRAFCGFLSATLRVYGQNVLGIETKAKLLYNGNNLSPHRAWIYVPDRREEA